MAGEIGIYFGALTEIRVDAWLRQLDRELEE